MRIAFLSLILLAAGNVSVSTQTAIAALPATPAVAAEQAQLDGLPTPEGMKELAAAICKGDDGAMAALEDTAERLYRGINFAKERDRVLANLHLMNVTFNEIGKQAGGGNQNAIGALAYCLKPDARQLRSFVPDALGIAAAAGHKPSMDILLDYQKHGILLSSAVGAMNKPAAKGDARAVAFLSDVLSRDDTRPLWYMASTGLKAAAAGGNLEAQKALAEQDRKHPGWNNFALRSTASTRPSIVSSQAAVEPIRADLTASDLFREPRFIALLVLLGVSLSINLVFIILRLRRPS